jgi:hypothetical protein
MRIGWTRPARSDGPVGVRSARPSRSKNLNGSIAQFTANVKRWRDGQMVLRWIGAALTDATCRFRAMRGYRDMKRGLDEGLGAQRMQWRGSSPAHLRR